MPGSKIVWVRTDHLHSQSERKRMITAALEAGHSSIVLNEEDADLRKLGRFIAIIRKGDELWCEGKRIGNLIDIKGPEDQKRASALKGKAEFILVDASDWKVIPLENIIAEFMGKGTKVIASASDMEEARLFVETLEVGVDGIAIKVPRPAGIKEFSVLSDLRTPEVQLSEAVIRSIRPVGVGDRVCVDTCSMLSIGEGMLIGSQSACLFLVHSEAMDSQYVASRPFRVNAGAVHAYVLGKDGRTRYLSEIKSGDELLAIKADGSTRPAVVGRAKIEVRPLLLLEAEADGRTFTTILQNAETIRLCTKDGSISVTELKEGDHVLVRIEKGARHFGHAINESIVEK